VKTKKWLTISVTLRTITVQGRAYTVKHTLRLNPAASCCFLFSSVPELAVSEQKYPLPRHYTMSEHADAIAVNNQLIRREIAKVTKEKI
jgi:hypothetical protein